MDEQKDNLDEESELNEIEPVIPSSGDNEVKKINKEMINAHMRRAFLLTPFVIAVLAVVAYGLYYNKINLGRFQKIKSKDLMGTGPKIKYVLRHSTPGALWLLFCLIYVIYKRTGTPALMPTSGNEHLVETANKILQNTLEHFVLHMTSQLILITFITAKHTINLIPVLNLLFIAGRLFFFIGYPKYRVFGFFLYFIPLMSVMSYISYRYIRLFL